MNWHYAQNGKQIGPVTDGQLLQLFQSGQINADTLVWREGMTDWQPYHQAATNLSPEIPPPIAVILPGENEVVCAECGKLFPAGETVRFGKASVCAACKPVFLQKLSENAPINTGELNYARISSRFAAVFLDGLLLGAINLGIKMLAGVFFAAAVSPVNRDGTLPSGFLAVQMILLAINVAIGVTYEGIFVGKYGATLGKMACKIRVVTADGGKVTYARAFGRYFAKLLSAFICLIGYIIALFDGQKRALHDHICNTRVVNK